jgi:D-arabinose 1-dehydrogenase-like Zn-dependent alcohol dehydrogenase
MPYTPIFRKELRIQGSRVAPRQVHREMIEFAAFLGIKPIIEKFPMTQEGITAAMDRLNSGKMRYRTVLAAQWKPEMD